MMKATLDTNILVSASFWRGNPYRILQAAVGGKFQAFVSPIILNEFSKVILRDFHVTAQEADGRVQTILYAVSVVSPRTKLQVIGDDPSDDRVLECAIEANANAIVSGDRHLLRLKYYENIPILKANEFLNMLCTENKTDKPNQT